MRHDPKLVDAVKDTILANPIWGWPQAERVLDTVAAFQNRKNLTPRQMQAHTFIVGYMLEHNMSPTTREIAEALDTTPGNIHRLIDAMVRKGWIKRVGKGARCLKQRLI